MRSYPRPSGRGYERTGNIAEQSANIKAVQMAFAAGCRKRFYLTPEQADLLRRTFGCLRAVYNRALHERETAWLERGERLRYADLSMRPAAWKVEWPWLADWGSQRSYAWRATAGANARERPTRRRAVSTGAATRCRRDLSIPFLGYARTWECSTMVPGQRLREGQENDKHGFGAILSDPLANSRAGARIHSVGRLLGASGRGAVGATRAPFIFLSAGHRDAERRRRICHESDGRVPIHDGVFKIRMYRPTSRMT